MTRFVLLIPLVSLLIIGCGHNTGNTKEPKADSTQAIHSYVPDSDYIFSDIQPQTILPRLFNSNNIDTAQAVLWKPTMYERQQVNVSADGWCHTNVDTVMHFKNAGGDSCAAVILTSYIYDYVNKSRKMEITGCHFCGVTIGAALFKRNKGNWYLYRIEESIGQLGNWGQYRFPNREMNSKISLLKMDNDFTCLSLKSGISGNSGVVEGFESLFWIDETTPEGRSYTDENILKEMFIYQYHLIEDLEYLGEGYNEEQTTLSFVPIKNKPANIVLTINKNGKVTKEQYLLNTDFWQYLKK